MKGKSCTPFPSVADFVKWVIELHTSIDPQGSNDLYNYKRKHYDPRTGDNFYSLVRFIIPYTFT